MKRLFGGALVASVVLLSGCDGLPFAAKSTGGSGWAPGQWQKTTIVLQKFNNFLFKEKSTGKTLSPDGAQTLPPDQVELEAGDFEELTYAEGRLRYASYGREANTQPYIVERDLDEGAFEELDKAIWDDKFFSYDLRNWDAKTRFPLYFLRYNQAGKGHEASFTPNLNKLVRTGRIYTTYLKQFTGEEKLPAGLKQTVFYLSAESGTLKISISTQTGDAKGEAVDTPWKIKSASYDTGDGFKSATLASDGQTFSLPQPAQSNKGAFQLMGLRVTTDGAPGDYETLIPIRLK